MELGTERAAMEAFVSRFNGALRENPSEFGDYFADDIVFTHWRWRGRELVGRDQVVKKYFEPIRESFDDVDFVVLDAIYGEDKLVIRGEFNATFARDWGVVPAHGRRVSYFAHDIYEFRNGKVVRAWYGNDTLNAARQFGLVADDGRVVGADPTAES